MKKRKQKTKSKLPILILIAGGLLILAAAVVLILQTGAPQTAAAPTNDPNLPYPNINRVSPAEAQAALDANKAIIIDVRAAEAYAASHIAGSISFPETDLPARLNELDPNQWIITYCT